MEDANPNANKRPRAQASGSGSGSALSSFGKGVTEQLNLYAAPIVVGIKTALTARALQLRHGERKSRKAAEALLAANREQKIVRTLDFHLSAEQKRLFPKVPAELRDQLRRLSQAMQEEALKERQEEALLRSYELASIVTGTAFTTEANAKLSPGTFSNHPSAALVLKDIIRAEQESFHLELAIKFKQLEATEASRAARRALNAQRTEQVRMQVEQQETAPTLKRYVEEAFRKAKPAFLKELKAAVASPPPKQVHFRQGGRKQAAADRTRGRSTQRNKPRPRPGERSSDGRSYSRGRSATPGRPPKQPQATRSASAPKRRSTPIPSRSPSWRNGNGDRGTHSRRPPSGKQGGSGRVGGSGGSKTGRRR
jgi:uncharacterized membrane protein YgcG